MCMCACFWCVCAYLLLFVCMLVSIYVSQHKCLWKVQEISVCMLSLFRLAIQVAEALANQILSYVRARTRVLNHLSVNVLPYQNVCTC